MAESEITTAIEHLQAAQAELLRASDEKARRSSSLSIEIDRHLRRVLAYLHHQPIDQVADTLTAFHRAEEKIAELCDLAGGRKV